MHVAVMSLRLQLALASMVSRRVPLCTRRAPAGSIYAGMSDRSRSVCTHAVLKAFPPLRFHGAWGPPAGARLGA
eukprot:1052130-Alexandrium_andersonii.AAC.1